jgi:hypothetical protein
MFSSKCRLFILVILAVIQASTVLSQNDKSPNYYNLKKAEKYTAGSYSDMIKTDVYSIIEGDVPVIWEHFFSDRFSVEAGVGLTLPYSLDLFSKVVPFTEINPNFKNNRFGMSLLIEPKLHQTIFGEDYQMVFIRLKNFNQLLVSEYGVGSGLPIRFGKYSIEVVGHISLCRQTLRHGGTEFKYLPNEFLESLSSSVESDDAFTFLFYFGIKFGRIIK